MYLQSALPPTRAGIYQIASIDYLPYDKVITARQKEILKTLKTVRMAKDSKYSTSVSTFHSIVTWRFQCSDYTVKKRKHRDKPFFGTMACFGRCWAIHKASSGWHLSSRATIAHFRSPLATGRLAISLFQGGQSTVVAPDSIIAASTRIQTVPSSQRRNKSSLSTAECLV